MAALRTSAAGIIVGSHKGCPYKVADRRVSETDEHGPQLWRSLHSRPHGPPWGRNIWDAPASILPAWNAATRKTTQERPGQGIPTEDRRDEKLP